MLRLSCCAASVALAQFYVSRIFMWNNFRRVWTSVFSMQMMCSCFVFRWLPSGADRRARQRNRHWYRILIIIFSFISIWSLILAIAHVSPMRWWISSQSIDTRTLLQRMTHRIVGLRKLDEQVRMMNNRQLDPVKWNGTELCSSRMSFRSVVSDPLRIFSKQIIGISTQ